MELNYHVARATNPKNKDQVVYKAFPVYYKRTSLDEICDVITLRSTMVRGDVEAILQAIITNSILFVLNSINIELGGLGRLVASIGTDQVEDPEKYTTSNVRNVRINLIPGKQMRENLGRVNFKKVILPGDI